MFPFIISDTITVAEKNTVMQEVLYFYSFYKQRKCDDDDDDEVIWTFYLSD